MGRLIQTSLPSVHLKPIHTDRQQIAEREEAQRTRTKEWHDRKARDLPQLLPNESVFIRDMQREGTVVKEVLPRSYLVDTGTGVVRRNEVHWLISTRTRTSNPGKNAIFRRPTRVEDLLLRVP